MKKLASLIFMLLLGVLLTAQPAQAASTGATVKKTTKCTTLTIPNPHYGGSAKVCRTWWPVGGGSYDGTMTVVQKGRQVAVYASLDGTVARIFAAGKATHGGSKPFTDFKRVYMIACYGPTGGPRDPHPICSRWW